MRKRTRKLLRLGVLLPVAALLLVWFFTSLGGVRKSHREEGRQLLETALHRGAAAYYAAEGAYPPDLDALIHYGGIRVDEERYLVFYEVFAENLMPQITVLVNEP